MIIITIPDKLAENAVKILDDYNEYVLDHDTSKPNDLDLLIDIIRCKRKECKND